MNVLKKLFKGKLEELPVKFECSSCGACCRNTAKTVAEAKAKIAKGDTNKLLAAVADFPFGTNEDGSCEKLVDGKCSVYNDRPTICNVEKSFEIFGAGMTKRGYFSMQGACCNYLIKFNKLGDELLVKEKY